MQRIARYGYVWKNKKTGKIYGTSIDVKDYKDLNEYTQVPKQKETEQKSDEKEISPKTRRAE